MPSSFPPSKIHVGDIVYCSDPDEDERQGCYANGLIVAALDQDIIGRPRARFHGDGRSHLCFYLRLESEQNRKPGENEFESD